MQAQPYRADKARRPGAALVAMSRGRTAGGMNPSDVDRAAALMARAGSMRKARAGRKQRNERLPR